jgi:hypothetical protein
MIKENSFGSKYVNVLQTALITEAHLAEGQFSLQEQTLNKVKSRAQRLAVSKREKQNLEPM